MRQPRIVAVASAVDLDFRYGCTPAWWQLWKGLYENGVDLLVTPYRGRPVESPWWRTAPNPTYREAESYAALRSGLARLKGDRYLRRAEESPEDTAFDRLTRETIWKVVTPRWRRHLDRLVERERPDAVLVFTVPMAHLRGIPTYLRERHGLPVVFYDGDVPMSLPEFGGMDTGFNYYHGADPSEYDLVLSNSEGGIARLEELGARRAEAVYWAADPEFFAPQPVEKDVDVSFYGYGDIIGTWYSRPDPFYCRQPLVLKEEAYAAVGGPIVSRAEATPGGPRRGLFYLYCRQQGLWPKEVAGRDPDTEPAWFDPFCPVRNVTREYPPTLLLHGDEDTDVPYEQSVQMAQAMKRAGVEFGVATLCVSGGMGMAMLVQRS